MTNHEQQELRHFIQRASTIEFGTDSLFEELPEGVLGINLKKLYGIYAQDAAGQSHGPTIESTLVALVCTTENLTAINSRKRLIECQCLDPQEELHVLDVLLSSHLKGHNKSPMLWHHRKWLLVRCPGLIELEHELSIIGYAAERHYMNYYAWGYARWLAQRRGDQNEQIAAWAWNLCYKHTSDTSMWTFLGHIDTSKTYQAQAQEMQHRYDRPAIAAALRLY